MKTGKIQYHERKSIFDRVLTVLLGVSCLFLVNLVARSNTADSLEAIKEHLKPEGVRAVSTTHDVAVEQDEKSFLRDKIKVAQAKIGFGRSEEKQQQVEIDLISEPNGSPEPISKEFGFWKNKYGIVHVLHSRFMQLQPDLIELGKARIELFKTFTLRSFREQSSQDFLWIIFTDPNLNPIILNEVLELIKFDENILLVGMNVEFQDFRDPRWLNKIEKVFSGDIQRLKDYHAVSQNHVYLETRIDMDDSMYSDFMRQTQGRVGQTIVRTCRNNDYNSSKYPKTEFRVFCPEHHLEWGYFNPWDKESTKGHIFGLHSPDFCITAGLSHAYQVGTKPLEVKGHHRLNKSYPQCRDVKNNTNCLDRVPDGGHKYVVLRSRTPTSAGMAGVVPGKEVVNSVEWKEKQDEAWSTIIFKQFGITPRSIWALRKKLSDNMEKILKDAITGQCTRSDFTCKDSSKNSLSQILSEVKKHDSAKG